MEMAGRIIFFSPDCNFFYDAHYTDIVALADSLIAYAISRIKLY